MNEWEQVNEETMDDDAAAEIVRQVWREEYERREFDGMVGQRFALTDKERFEVDEIIKERLAALDWPEIIQFKRKLWEEFNGCQHNGKVGDFNQEHTHIWVGNKWLPVQEFWGLCRIWNGKDFVPKQQWIDEINNPYGKD